MTTTAPKPTRSANTATNGNALWSGQAHMPSVIGTQLEIVRGEGAYVFTSAGQKLLDGTAGLWHTNIGHGRTELAEAAHRQMMTLSTYHTFGRFLNNRAVELAERVVGLAPFADAKVIFGSGGSDGIDAACKLARRHFQVQGKTEKTFILSRTHSYHGLHGYGTSIAGLQPNRDGYGTESLIPETARIATNDLAQVEATIHEIGAHRIAAIVAEPVIGTGGVIPPAPGYLEGLRALTRAHDILLIADEVITGFGRTGRMFASDRYNIDPDMLVMAKGITSGYAPLGGVLVSPVVWSAFYDGPDAPTFRHGLTYAGHATSAAVALANIDILENEGLLARVQDLESVLTTALDGLGTIDAVVDVRVAGLLGAVELADGVDVDRVVQSVLDNGVISRNLRGHSVQISPPFIVTDAELIGMVDTIAAAISDAT